MAVTISLYDHTARLMQEGSLLAASTYRVKLLTTATFNATHTTLAATGGTEVSNANGYTTGGVALTGVTISTVTTNDSTFDANDATWTATGAGITAAEAILYCDTLANDPPLAFIDFGGNKTADAGTDFKIVWNASGIFVVTVA